MTFRTAFPWRRLTFRTASRRVVSTACAAICLAFLSAPRAAHADAPAGSAASTTTSATTFTFRNSDGGQVFGRRWSPGGTAKAAVLVVHGLGEHSGRYDRFARVLNAAGYVVYAIDLRGHGQTAKPGALGVAGPDAWNGTVRDLAQLAGIVRSEQAGLPQFLFGHSLGSAYAQRYTELHGSELAGTILSGTFGTVDDLTKTLAGIDAASKGSGALQRTIAPQLFAGFNKPFQNRTGFEWLSRDPAEVDKYVHDPLCGFAATNAYVDDIFHGFAVTWAPENEALIPVSLPILIFGGDTDPVGGNTVSVKALADRYDAHGIRDLHVTFYPGARHETLNETNRDVVMRDVVVWMNEHQTTH